MELEYALFEWINQDLANPILDAILPLYREKTTWIPLYVLLAVLIYRDYGWQKLLYFLLLVAIVIGFVDQLAANVLKPLVGRLRPCAQTEIAESVRDLVGCGGQFSFPSNHATNHFALAHVLALTFLRRSRLGRWLVYAWALSISLAQVYVGKHWPLDILAGAGIGVVVASLGVYLYRSYLGQHAIE